MAKQVSLLDVLIASPSDVKDEREAADRVIQELNRMIEKSGVQLRPKQWEHDTVSQIGDRPQALVNEQIANTCDIFVGIMWSRVGTPTGVDQSGTIEEFRRTMKRLEADARSVRVLFYFCDRHLDPKILDIDQFAAVKKFRSEVEQLGLVTSYTTINEFELKIRAAIHRHVNEWGDTWGHLTDGTKNAANVESPQVITASSRELTGLEDEVGFLDAIEDATNDAEVATAALDRMVSAINDLGENIGARSAELRALNAQPSPDVARFKKVTNLAADDLDNFAARLAADLPIHRKAFARSLERMSDVVLLSQDFKMTSARRDELIAFRTQLQHLDDQINGAVANTVEFRQAVADSPRMTTKFNGAKRQALQVLNEFLDSANDNRRLIEAIHKQVNETLAKSEGDEL